jgi:hypothetical protein
MYNQYMVNVNMDGKTLFDGASPKTQSLDAVKALLTWKGRAVDPLPSVVEFANEGEESRLMLVLSNDKKNYYVTTARACSCPSATYHQEPCKHQRKYFGAKQDQVTTGSIRPTGGWVGPNGEKANGPVEA